MHNITFIHAQLLAVCILHLHTYTTLYAHKHTLTGTAVFCVSVLKQTNTHNSVHTHTHSCKTQADPFPRFLYLSLFTMTHSVTSPTHFEVAIPSEAAALVSESPFSPGEVAVAASLCSDLI